LPPVERMTAPTQKNDIAFGLKSEEANLDILQTFLDTQLHRKGGYAVFDFENPTKTIFVELKSRRIGSKTYDTALIGFNKIAFANHFDDGTQFWFAFCYTDGVFVIKYDKAQFDKYEVRNEYVRGARNDTTNKPQKVCLIPIEDLTELVMEEEEVEEKKEEVAVIEEKIMNVVISPPPPHNPELVRQDAEYRERQSSQNPFH
jgi:hypothetical protein